MNKLGIIALSLLAVCVSAENNNARTMEGETASDGQFPYQASIRDIVNNHLCGAAIISSSWLITAAECVEGRTPQIILAVVGTNSLTSGGTVYHISQVKIHEKYNSRLIQNNIALLRTDSLIQFGATVQPIPLANTIAPAGTLCTFSGWGFLETYSNKLKFISLRLLSHQECEKAMSEPVEDSQLCTLHGNVQRTCTADSGGPLVFDGLLQGVLSWGIPCISGYPDGYSSIPAYHQWISLNTGI